MTQTLFQLVNAAVRSRSPRLPRRRNRDKFLQIEEAAQFAVRLSYLRTKLAITWAVILIFCSPNSSVGPGAAAALPNTPALEAIIGIMRPGSRISIFAEVISPRVRPLACAKD